MSDKKNKFTSVSIPTFLFEKAKQKSLKSGFPSVSAYVGYIMREILSEDGTDHTRIETSDAEMVKNRLRSLGYIDD